MSYRERRRQHTVLIGEPRQSSSRLWWSLPFDSLLIPSKTAAIAAIASLVLLFLLFQYSQNYIGKKTGSAPQSYELTELLAEFQELGQLLSRPGTDLAIPGRGGLEELSQIVQPFDSVGV